MASRDSRLAAICMLTATLVAVLAHSAWADQGSAPLDLLSVDGLKQAAQEFWGIIGPGGKLHPAYFLDHKGHLVIEGLLVLLIVYLALQQAFQVKPQAEAPLTDKVCSHKDCLARWLWPSLSVFAC